MEIRFCSVCNESIPDGEFDAGRAIVSGEKSQHVACALKRSVEMSGMRSWLTFGLALFAAGLATFLLVAKLGEKEEPPRIVEVPAVVEQHVADLMQQSEARLNARIKDDGQRMKADFQKHLEGRLADHGSSIKDATVEAMDQLLRDTGKGLSDQIRTVDKMVIQLQQQMANIVDWKIRIQDEADQLRKDLEAAEARRQPDPAVPTEAAPKKPDDEPAPSSTEADEIREKEIDRWIHRLDDADEDIVFSATIELARLKALRATQALVKVLNKHKDFYARLGAATALGEIQAVAGVPDLIEALNDKDDLVRTAASEALHRITGQDFNFVSGLTKNERIRIQKKWRQWWRDNETEVRRRLGQAPR